LRRPIYKPTAAYGHFGRTGPGFTWERTDRAAALRKPRAWVQTSAQAWKSAREHQRRISSTLADTSPFQLQQSESNNFAFEEHTVAIAEMKKGDVKDISLADAGKRKMSGPRSRCRCSKSFASVLRKSSLKDCARSLLACDQRNREPRDCLRDGGRGSSAVRVESAFHASEVPLH